MHALHRQLQVYGHKRMAREQAAQKRHDGERGLTRVHDDRRLVGHVIEQGPRDTAGTVPETGVADVIDAVSVVRDGIRCLVRRPHDGVKKLVGHSSLRFSTHDAPSQSCVPTNGQTIRAQCAKGMQGDKRTRINTECTEAPAPYLSRGAEGHPPVPQAPRSLSAVRPQSCRQSTSERQLEREQPICARWSGAPASVTRLFPGGDAGA